YWSLLARGDDPGTPRGKPVAQWSVAGRSAPRLDIPDKVTGRPRFLHDLVLPGMAYGRVVRPPARAAELTGLGEARLPPGAVVVRDGSFLGVVAGRDRDAVRAAGLLARAASWRVTESLPDERDLAGFLLAAPAQEQPVTERRDEAAAAGVTRRLAADYTRPFIAHASMAPGCAIARWSGRPGGEAVTVWSHSQGPFALRAAIAAGLGLRPEQVTVQHVEGAGAYGHNSADDVALDAVLLARAVPGRPVRVQWTREDEMGWGPLGPAMLIRLSAGLDSGGRIASWRQDVYSNGFIGRPGSGGEPRLLALSHLAGGGPMPPAPDGPPTGAMGATRNAVPLYDIPDLAVTRHRLLDMPVRTSSLRSLGAFGNVFAIESFMDELAAAAGSDPVEFRLAHLSDLRARRVLTEAAGLAGWADRAGRDRGEGTGFGAGVARYKGTSGYCAAIAEVGAETEVRVRRLWLAVDVGRVISPDGVSNQVEGGAVQSASWAVSERVRFDRAGVTSVSWDTYPILRFTQVPEVTVTIVPSDEPETGAGELAQGPVAGAIGNAVADAVGTRVRDLPLTREQVARAIEEA
ncbi:MAG: xanthine dehydrogenase family protein molybdopterin-binding subunit, partial [Actinobacteria bacterium]|nr:xanthine dehydrogenase family protein molybdopterin-binding subunit [Actinomycetota bacterium]